MFIEDKIQEIWDKNDDSKYKVQLIYDTLVTEVVNPNNYDCFVTSIKRADNIFKLFAKRNNLNINWFKDNIIMSINSSSDVDTNSYLIKKLGW